MSCTPELDDVKRLQAELSAAMAFKCSLEAEIRDLLSPTTQGYWNAMLNLPTELLLEIFNLVVATNPMHIGNIMLVCRLWQHLILSTPRLWTKIQIIVPKKPEDVTQCVTYCAYCVERSKGYPLDIVIDFTALNSDPSRRAFWDATKDTAHSVSTRLPFIRQWRYLIERRESGRDTNCHYYLSLYLEPLLALARTKGSAVARWKSLEIIAGNLGHHESFFKAVFSTNLFEGSTLLLESIKLHHVDHYTLENDNIIKYTVVLRKFVQQTFRSLPSLRILDLVNITLPLDTVEINPLKLEQLSLHYFNMDQFLFSLQCSNVTRLRIGGNIVPYDGSVAFSRGPISFPRLKLLELGSWLPIWFYQYLVAPSLETIVFETSQALKAIIPARLPPSITRIECLWGWRDSTYDILPLFIPKLMQVSVETIVCTQAEKQSMMRAIREYMERQVSPSLKLLLIAPTNHGIKEDLLETIDLTKP